MREASTYRSERRHFYFSTEALRHEYTWAEWNNSPLPRPMGGHVARSKYMPHIGAKQRSKARAA